MNLSSPSDRCYFLFNSDYVNSREEKNSEETKFRHKYGYSKIRRTGSDQGSRDSTPVEVPTNVNSLKKVDKNGFGHCVIVTLVCTKIEKSSNTLLWPRREGVKMKFLVKKRKNILNRQEENVKSVHKQNLSDGRFWHVKNRRKMEWSGKTRPKWVWVDYECLVNWYYIRSLVKVRTIYVSLPILYQEREYLEC